MYASANVDSFRDPGTCRGHYLSRSTLERRSDGETHPLCRWQRHHARGDPLYSSRSKPGEPGSGRRGDPRLHQYPRYHAAGVSRTGSQRLRGVEHGPDGARALRPASVCQRIRRAGSAAVLEVAKLCTQQQYRTHWTFDGRSGKCNRRRHLSGLLCIDGPHRLRPALRHQPLFTV